MVRRKQSVNPVDFFDKTFAEYQAGFSANGLLKKKLIQSLIIFKERAGLALTTFTDWPANKITSWRSSWLTLTGRSMLLSTTSSRWVKLFKTWWCLSVLDLRLQYPCQSMMIMMMKWLWLKNRFVQNNYFVENSNSGWSSSRWLQADGGSVQRRPLHSWRLNNTKRVEPEWDEVHHKVRF